jgi:hypothetical protein
MRPLFVVATLVGMISGCGDPTLLRVLDEVDPGGDYTTVDVPIGSLEDIGAVEGSRAKLFGGADVSFLSTELPEDGGESRDQFVDDEHEVSAHWVQDGDVVVATDFDSLQMFSIYAHLEQAAIYFEALGVDRASVDQAPVYYEPGIESADGIPSEDNALYHFGIDGFIVLEHDVLEDIPLGMNSGVMAHEYGHRVWSYETWGGERFALGSQLDFSDPGTLSEMNLLTGCDEGIADFFAAMITGNPRFIEPSLYDYLGDERSLDVLRQVESSWVTGNQPAAGGAYYPYALGAVLASTLWHVAEDVGQDVTAAAVLAAERATFEAFSATLSYSFGDFENEILQALPGGARSAACSRFEYSYQTEPGLFTAVCP